MEGRQGILAFHLCVWVKMINAETIFGASGLLTLNGRNYRADQQEYANRVFNLLDLPIHDQTNVMIGMAEAGIGKTLGYGFPAVHHVIKTKKHCVIAFSTQKLRDQAEIEIRFARDLMMSQGYRCVDIIKTASYWDYFSLKRVEAKYNLIIGNPDYSDADKNLISQLYEMTKLAYEKKEFIENGAITSRDLGFESDINANDLCLRYDGEKHPFKLNSKMGVLIDPDAKNVKENGEIIGTYPSIILTTHAMLLRNFNLMKRMAHTESVGFVIVDECQDILSIADGMIDVRVNLTRFLEDLKDAGASRYITTKLRNVIKQMAPFYNDIFCRNEQFGILFDDCRRILEELWDDVYSWVSTSALPQETKDRIDGYLVGLGDYLSLYLSMNRFQREFAEQTMQIEAVMGVDKTPTSVVLRGVSTRPGSLLSWLWYGKYRIPHVLLTTAFLRNSEETPVDAPVKRSQSVVRKYRYDIHLGDKPYVIESIQHIEKYGKATFYNVPEDAPTPFIKVNDTYIRNPAHLDMTIELIKELYLYPGKTLVLCNSYADIEEFENRLAGYAVFAQEAGDGGKYKELFLESSEDHRILLSLEWAGLSIKGWNNVVISRIPIAPQDDSKKRNHEAMGNSAWKNPSNNTDRAIEKLYQGYGRGIRDDTDVCAFYNIDPRMPLEEKGRFSMYREAIARRFRTGFRDPYSKTMIKIWNFPQEKPKL